MKQDIRKEFSKELIVEHRKGGGKIILKCNLRKQAVRMLSEGSTDWSTRIVLLCFWYFAQGTSVA